MPLIIPAIRPSDGQHWYDRNGSPVYEVRGKNGALRSATLRDARELGLVPGVSSILQMEAKPMLVRWQIEQALMSALTLPRLADESDDAFIIRAREDSQEQARKAAERGTHIHAAIQGHFEGGPYSLDDAPYVESVSSWIAQRYGLEGWEAEKAFAHPLGYGGKSDLVNVGEIVIDVKCKDFGPEKSAKDLAYPEHCMQLAAYAHGFDFLHPDCANVFVSTRVPGLICVREWDDEEIAEGLLAFGLLLKLWKLRRKYDGAFMPTGVAA